MIPPSIQGFFVRELVEMHKQIKRKLPRSSIYPGTYRAWGQQPLEGEAYKRFFEKMNRPGVVFVAAAGNENGVLDGSNYGPGESVCPTSLPWERWITPATGLQPPTGMIRRSSKPHMTPA